MPSEHEVSGSRANTDLSTQVQTLSSTYLGLWNKNPGFILPTRYFLLAVKAVVNGYPLVTFGYMGALGPSTMPDLTEAQELRFDPNRFCALGSHTQGFIR